MSIIMLLYDVASFRLSDSPPPPAPPARPRDLVTPSLTAEVEAERRLHAPLSLADAKPRRADHRDADVDALPR